VEEQDGLRVQEDAVDVLVSARRAEIEGAGNDAFIGTN